jgi:hypothetical protein
MLPQGPYKMPFGEGTKEAGPLRKRLRELRDLMKSTECERAGYTLAYST